MPFPTSRSGRPARRGGFLSRSPFPTETVRIIHLEGTVDEVVTEVVAHIQPRSGFFDVDAPVYEGDVVEVADPRGGPKGRERRLAAEVRVNNNAPEAVQHIEVIWGKAPAMRVAPVRRLTFENLHVEVQKASGDMFADGHYESAVQEAFKSIEVRVRILTGLEQSGVKLIQAAFGGESPALDISSHGGHSGKDEREGFLAIFRGVMLGIRNPGAHELFGAGDPQQALEYLGFASLLHRRVDAAATKPV